MDDKNTEAIVITRPRRFRKTFNLSQLHYFLASCVYGKSTEGLFDQLNIATCGNEYMQHQGISLRQYGSFSSQFGKSTITNCELSRYG